MRTSQCFSFTATLFALLAFVTIDVAESSPLPPTNDRAEVDAESYETLRQILLEADLSEEVEDARLGALCSAFPKACADAQQAREKAESRVADQASLVKILNELDIEPKLQQLVLRLLEQDSAFTRERPTGNEESWYAIRERESRNYVEQKQQEQREPTNDEETPSQSAAAPSTGDAAPTSAISGTKKADSSKSPQKTQQAGASNAPLPAQAQTIEAKSASMGEDCSKPEFSFEWQGTSELNLVMKWPVTRDFRLYLRSHRSSVKSEFIKSAGLGSGPIEPIHPKWLGPFEIRAEKGVEVRLPDINPATLDLRGSDGLVIIKWEIVADQVATCSLLWYGESDPIVALRKHLFGIDAGAVYSLETDGSFESSAEAALSTKSRWNKFSIYSDLRFSRIGEIDSEDPVGDTDGDGGDPATMPAAATEEDNSVNPFAEGTNVVSFNTWIGFNPLRKKYKVRIDPPFALIAGVGLTTRPTEVAEIDANPRVFAGIRWEGFRANLQKAETEFKDSSFSFQLAYARDDFWEFDEMVDEDGDDATPPILLTRDQRNRVVLDVSYVVPGTGDRARLKLGFHADLPTGGDGPSDVRFSALAAISPSQIFGISKNK